MRPAISPRGCIFPRPVSCSKRTSRCSKSPCRACRWKRAFTPTIPAPMAESDASRGPVSRGGVARRPLWAVGAVLLGAFLAHFDSRLASVVLPESLCGFSLGFSEGAWLSTAAIGSQIFIAPAVAWLATVFGLRRVLGVPSLVYALVSLVIPFVHDFPTLIVLSVVHGMLL